MLGGGVKSVQSGDGGKPYAIVVLLCAASVASAFPTVISGNAPVRSISTSDDCATNVTTYCLGSSAACDQISELGRAMLQPPSGSQITVTSENQRCLPALPSAIAMVLTGFICISLIQDRRAWLAALAGLLWVGQTGIWALPELTSRLSRRVHSGQQVNTALAVSYPLGGGYYPDSYSEEIQYIGLLHHHLARNTTGQQQCFHKSARLTHPTHPVLPQRAEYHGIQFQRQK